MPRVPSLLRPTIDSRERRQGLWLLAAMVALMWVLEVINSLDHQALDAAGGIIPRDPGRLWSILSAPFLHASFGHLLDNTLPFVFTGAIVALRGAARVAVVTVIVVLVSGLGTWATGSGGTVTVGASGIVFGYAAYLLTRGFFNHSVRELLVGAVVAVLWGAVLLSSLVPQHGVSWQDHAWGAVGGGLAAWVLRHGATPPRVARTGRVAGPLATGSLGVRRSIGRRR